MIEFKKKVVSATILDPRKGFERKTMETEMRFDPLTGESGRLAHFGMINVQKEDFSTWDTQEARERCPFCIPNIDRITPKFPPEILPEAHLHRGEVRVIPNISPYDQYSVLTVLGGEHLLPLEKFTKTLLRDAFNAGLEFFRIISAKEPQLPYYIIAWNYMPPSGGGLIHPHQQVIITDSPGNLYRKTLEKSKIYFERFGKNYWAELCETEKSKGERFIAKIGESQWIVPFVPLGVLGDFQVIFPAVHTIFDLNEAALDDLVTGLLQLFGYFSYKKIYSFNMGLFFAPIGEKEKYFSLQARIIPRTFLNPVQKPSDINSLQLALQEPFAVEFPENLCQDVKSFWKENF